MPLRNQPYLPLYVQDFLTDEKLNECSAQSTGVYIKIMCLMHKSDEYGTILLKQKDKQKSSNIENFAYKLLKHLPFSFEVITDSITELVNEKVLTIEGDKLFQRRMVKDNMISEKRALSGSEGGKRTQFAKAKVKAKPKAKVIANTEYEIEDENENENKDTIEDRILRFTEKVKSINHGFTNGQLEAFLKYWTDHNPGDKKCRWEKEKQFYFASRIATWKTNDKKFSKPEPDKQAVDDYIKKHTA
jgi:hypothetical protein